MFGFLNACVYSGKLISFLMTKENELPINDLSDILSRPEYQLMVQHGAVEEAYFKAATEWPQEEIWSKHMDGKSDAFVNSSQMDTELMKDEKNVLFCTSYYAKMYLPNYPCNIIKLKVFLAPNSTHL